MDAIWAWMFKLWLTFQVGSFAIGAVMVGLMAIGFVVIVMVGLFGYLRDKLAGKWKVIVALLLITGLAKGAFALFEHQQLLAQQRVQEERERELEMQRQREARAEAQAQERVRQFYAERARKEPQEAALLLARKQAEEALAIARKETEILQHAAEQQQQPDLAHPMEQPQPGQREQTNQPAPAHERKLLAAIGDDAAQYWLNPDIVSTVGSTGKISVVRQSDKPGYRMIAVQGCADGYGRLVMAPLAVFRAAVAQQPITPSEDIESCAWISSGKRVCEQLAITLCKLPDTIQN